jgi:hypothetical protein
VFSYNDVVGQRTTEKGYGKAPAYVNGATLQEVGGGICQVSSTIYYCTLLADLEIVERYPHTYAAPYLPLGMDATVSWNGPNFRFKNSAEYPIRIEAWRDGSELHVQLIGTKTDDTYIEMTYELLETIPVSIEYREDASLAPGETKTAERGTNGSRVRTYRTKYAADGTVISKKLEANSRYSGHKREILVALGELEVYGDASTAIGEAPVLVENEGDGSGEEAGDGVTDGVPDESSTPESNYMPTAAPVVTQTPEWTAAPTIAPTATPEPTIEPPPEQGYVPPVAETASPTEAPSPIDDPLYEPPPAQ